MAREGASCPYKPAAQNIAKELKRKKAAVSNWGWGSGVALARGFTFDPNKIGTIRK